MRDDGDTILHCAIQREFFDLALIILRKYPDLGKIQNSKGITPLKVLATRPSAFKSTAQFSWWKNIIYRCIHVEDLDVEETFNYWLDKEDDPGNTAHNEKFPQNHLTCYDFFTGLSRLAATCGAIIEEPQSSEKDEHKIEMQETSNVAAEKKSKEEKQPTVPANYATCLLFVKLTYMCTLILSGVGMPKIRNIKQKHKWGLQLLNAFMEAPYESYIGSGDQPLEMPYGVDETHPYFLYKMIKEEEESKDKHWKEAQENKKKDDKEKIDIKETALLVAARNGLVEMVTMILWKIPSALHDITSDKRNVFHVAVKNRQPFVIEVLRKELTEQVTRNLIQAVDIEENTVLHLVANKTSDWHVDASALQMMWDVHWFQYIEDLVPHNFILRIDKDGKTAREIFEESHQEILKESSEWLKETAKSFSVVAVLIAGVAFTTSTTVPGGTNEDTGKPALEGHPAFDVFAISSLIGLCFSIMALMVFLFIHTSRKYAKDFGRDLPFKLLLGFNSLFVSIVAMFISFCPGHFFLLSDKYKQILFPVYATTCFFVTFYGIAPLLALYNDILKVFLDKVPQPSGNGKDFSK